MRLTTRLIGAEIEYLASSEDEEFEYVNEYYSGMREVNSILLPGTNVLDSLMVLKDIINAMQEKIKNPIGTSGWLNSYGYAFNGIHLHLSGALDARALEHNILSVIWKYGLSPRTVSSWHVMHRRTNYNFKDKRKHSPVYRTPRGTHEIRILDIEYFMNDDILKDIAIAIEDAYKGNKIVGNSTWAASLINIPLEHYITNCEFLDTNLSTEWEKEQDGIYRHKRTRYRINFKELEDWRRERESRDYEENIEEAEEVENVEEIISTVNTSTSSMYTVPGTSSRRSGLRRAPRAAVNREPIFASFDDYRNERDQDEENL